MIYILHIETTGEVCSVALSNNNKLIMYKESTEKNSHSSKLAILVKEILTETNIDPKHLSAIAVSKGPGSYTGLRIGISFAKGLAFACNIPLIAIETTKILAQGCLNEHNIENESILCPMIDARRMEVYMALYSFQLKEIQSIQAVVLNQDLFSNYKQTIYFFGSGMNKWKNLLIKIPSNFHFIEHQIPHAKYMHHLAFQYYQNKQFEDIAYFEPLYLKDFIAIESKKNLLSW